ncbi:MAG TPA: hypothetical protein VLC93_06730 [Myxococcota bacterium]|nr:hypothetical protein [Myxococcota bacterium]
MTAVARLTLSSDTRARNAEYLGSTLALRGVVQAAGQHDDLPSTDHDKDRCGAAVAVAAAMLRGPDGARALIEGLRAPAAGNASRSAVVERAGEELRTQRTLSIATVQRLQDLLFEVNSDGEPGTDRNGQELHFRVAGLPARRFVESPESKDWPVRLSALLQPGEAVPLFLENQGQEIGHIILAGRNARGGLYLYDSLRSPTLMEITEPDAAERLARAMGFHSRYIVRVSSNP